MTGSEIKTVDTGLANVPVCTSDISETTVDREGNPILMYRGYSIWDLVKGPFEESVYLILHGHLPNRRELEEFTNLLNDNMPLPPEVVEHLKTYPKHVHLMDLVLTAFSYARMYDREYQSDAWRRITGDPSPRSNLMLDAGIRTGAKIPAIFCYGYRMLNGKNPIPPDRQLSYAENILKMLGFAPDEEYTNAFNTVLILYLDHTINCSTFTALVAESSGVDPYGPQIAASVALKGVLHGGANDLAAVMFDEIKRPQDARDYILGKLSRKEIVFGFGHRLAHYKGNVESRVRITESIAKPLALKKGLGSLVEIYDIVKKVMLEEKERAPNLDFPVALLLRAMGMPLDINTPLFQASRHFGWIANIRRQRGSNAPIYRPTQVYTGPTLEQMRKYIPISQRG
ncbi:MAG: citrate/2-methylcitrate synthase [Pseudomonadota bacterium]